MEGGDEIGINRENEMDVKSENAMDMKREIEMGISNRDTMLYRVRYELAVAPS